MASVFFKPFQDLVAANGGNEQAVLKKLAEVSDETSIAHRLLWEFRINELRNGRCSLWNKERPTPLAQGMAKLWSVSADEIFPPCYENDPDGFAAHWQSYNLAAATVTRRVGKTDPDILKNLDLWKQERLKILQGRYPEAPKKLLDAVACYQNPIGFARAIHDVEPLKSSGRSLRTIEMNLSNILRGVKSGWNPKREPNLTIQAAANLMGWPVGDFVPVLTDDERLNDFRIHYPNARDALLQVIVPFKTCRDFTKQLLQMETSVIYGMNHNAANVQLNNILWGRNQSDLKWKKEVDGSREPTNVILAVAAFTGLDPRYFLRRSDGGIDLKRGERITYDPETKKYSIVSSAPKAAAKLKAPTA